MTKQKRHTLLAILGAVVDARIEMERQMRAFERELGYDIDYFSSLVNVFDSRVTNEDLDWLLQQARYTKRKEIPA